MPVWECFTRSRFPLLCEGVSYVAALAKRLECFFLEQFTAACHHHISQSPLWTRQPRQIERSPDSKLNHYIWVFPKIGVPPKWMVYIMENPLKNGWFEGTTIFGNLQKYTLKVKKTPLVPYIYFLILYVYLYIYNNHVCIYIYIIYITLFCWKFLLVPKATWQCFNFKFQSKVFVWKHLKTWLFPRRRSWSKTALREVLYAKTPGDGNPKLPRGWRVCYPMVNLVHLSLSIRSFQIRAPR